MIAMTNNYNNKLDYVYGIIGIFYIGRQCNKK